MTLKDLVASYGATLPEPAAHYGDRAAHQPDFRPSVESFDRFGAGQSVILKRKPPDTAWSSAVRLNLLPRFGGGEVRAPGDPPGQVRLRDAVYLGESFD
jgi:hypothetical protein